MFIGSSSAENPPLQNEAPDLHNHLLHIDRSREPLDLTDIGISLDNWQHNTSTNHQQHQHFTNIEPTMTSSMPELTTSIEHEPITPDDLPTPDVSEIVTAINADESKEKKAVKGVRFEGIQDTLPRSRSYSGRTDSKRSKGSKRKSCSENRLNDRPSTSTGRRHHRSAASTAATEDNDEDSDASSVCSTCSSSSSSTDDHAYQLPQRRHYGGVRVSYVPNDAIACARKRKQQIDGNDKDNKNCIIS